MKMNPVVLRIIHATHLGRNLPHREKRDEALKCMLAQDGGNPEIIDWEPPKNPNKLYDELAKIIAQIAEEGKIVCFYEIGVADIGLVSFLTLYKWANSAMAPVLFPRYLKGQENIPSEFSTDDENFLQQFGQGNLVFDGFWSLQNVNSIGSPLNIPVKS